ncbi:MAG: TIGR00153 family protein [Desulfatitalea sp.]|nr:TIGR00153 family protein [Desulfatitalea sp.]NNJ99950.1 TIGR00153 family protein [Desulfatitalea sp.]
MRIPFMSMFMASPFDGLEEHAEKVKACAHAFKKAIECHLSTQCDTYESFQKEVVRLESEADAVKRRIRGHLPKGTLLPIDKFQLFRYLREQDAVLDAVEDTLEWISFREDPGIPDELADDFINFIGAVILPIEALVIMIREARTYFKTYKEEQRNKVKEIIATLRRQEHDADRHERHIKRKTLNLDIDPVTIFHMIRLAEYIGSIADHAENAGDMMRAMIAR